MKLFYIRAEAHTGDADGPVNMDLFVHAERPSQAVAHWIDHYKEWDEPDGRKVKCYDVSQTALCPCVMDWARIPMTEHPVKFI